MLRFENKIRLTQKELDLYETLTGKGRPAPTTVREHNQRLQDSIDAYATAETAEERSLAGLAETLIIEG
ncbi:hypothetical protein [Burkholderia cenocepacia]|uniref:hypothetical protein n=1 Tax=Burkholderia cenocepacia TaxID=95486 RepID=UPI000761000D|nr:hypothetical protein [Burkholderia cenocepacia]KWU19124.1 hypothetical protein AS149_12820 [Burkholderia cenocepacia]